MPPHLRSPRVLLQVGLQFAPIYGTSTTLALRLLCHNVYV